MKISHSISILFITLFISQLTYSQSTRFELNRTITLHPEDAKTKNITLKVNKNTINLYLNITCKVRLGNLSIEVYNPNGEKQGEFSIESQMDKLSNDKYERGIIGVESNKREIVEGNISKDITNPIIGDWIVKLIPEKTYANINIQSQAINKD